MFKHMHDLALSLGRWPGNRQILQPCAQHACCSTCGHDMQGLAKYAFGLGTAQVALTTLAFTLFALPVGNGLGTQILVRVFHASPQIAAIRTLDEAIVIGAALSLSSSAFVLQLLSERGELTTKFGSATLGILLLQVCTLSDILRPRLAGSLQPALHSEPDLAASFMKGS